MKIATQHMFFFDLRYIFAGILAFGVFAAPFHNAWANIPYQSPYYTQEQYNAQYYRYLRDYSQFYNIPEPYYPGYNPKEQDTKSNNRALMPYMEQNQLYEYYLE